MSFPTPIGNLEGWGSGFRVVARNDISKLKPSRNQDAIALIGDGSPLAAMRQDDGRMITDNQALSVFFEIHDNIPRGGPGEFESTARAFGMLTGLGIEPAILDMGCGPGVQTMDLAGITQGPIVAIDTHEPFLTRLRDGVERLDLADRITVLNRDMSAPDLDAEASDVIWAEGSVYLLGFENALSTWKPLLKKAGYLAATELTWLKPDPPEEARSFWSDEYPAMQDIDANLAAVRRCGYELIGHFTLPESAWWAPYYTPIENRLNALRTKYADDPDALAVLDLEQAEIDLYRRYSDYYGYVFYVMQVTV